MNAASDGVAPELAHRLAVILCADVVGYSRLMGIDEEGTLAALEAVRRNLVDPKVLAHRGRIARTMGDGLSSSSPAWSMRCAARSKYNAKCRDSTAERRRTDEFVSAWRSTSAMWLAKAAASMATTSPPPHAWKASPSPAASMSAGRCATRCGIGCRSPSRISATTRSRTIARAVRVFRVRWEEAAGAPVDAARARSVAPPPEKPSIAVLPFQNLSNDTEAEFFLDSLAEDLITELSQARWISVVARNTSFNYKGKPSNARQIARELAVRYVVEGSLRKSADRIRIGCQLVDAASGQQLWADRFDGTLEESFEPAGPGDRAGCRRCRADGAERRDRTCSTQARGEPERLRSHLAGSRRYVRRDGGRHRGSAASPGTGVET